VEWVEAFYARQDELLGVYTGDMADDGIRRAASIARLAGAGRKRVLELGAGGGRAAAATADLGHDVVAVELVPTAAEHARRLAEREREGSLSVIRGDFYEVEPGGGFDVVCYWDGFGVGSDADQRRLLRRVRGWLAAGGCALLDVNTPWYWAGAAGRELRWGEAARRYGFDADGCRLLDRWWSVGAEGGAVTQSLRCYSPADLRLLLEGTGLVLDSLEPGGAVDARSGRFIERVPPGRAMQYLAKLVPASRPPQPHPSG
jgi:SAM-dependent methyltransferase